MFKLPITISVIIHVIGIQSIFPVTITHGASFIGLRREGDGGRMGGEGVGVVPPVNVKHGFNQEGSANLKAQVS